MDLESIFRDPSNTERDKINRDLRWLYAKGCVDYIDEKLRSGV